MKFSDFLREQKEKHAVLAFGRMNPITNGHEKVVKTVKKLAKEVGGSHHIVLSHSQDAKKNPLTVEQKIKHAKHAFADTNFTAASTKAPTFFDHAEALYKKGVTHLHMISGSDRVGEYEKLLNKYNGTQKGARFNFKSIQVHSAGERDPDAEGVTGISASKMREAAKEGDFDTFKKGAPSTMSTAQAKQMYNDVRKGMRLHEEILREGVHDKGIFKAVFLGGGPGSGKDYVLSKTLDGHGLTEINSDKALEYLMDKEGLDKKMPDNEESQRNAVRKRAKNVTELRQRLALHGRNGLIINGTGDNPEKYANIKDMLEKLGYETQMIMVNTADEVSKQRNIERGQRGGRTVPENIRTEKWQAVQDARPMFGKLFRDGYVEFDNSEDLRSAPPEVVEAKTKELEQIYKNVQKFVSKPPKNEDAKGWIATELGKKDTTPIRRDMKPHKDAGTHEDMNTMGLEYYGFGRYGKDGKVTHRSVHGSLAPVDKISKTVETHQKRQERETGKVSDNKVIVRTHQNRHQRARAAKKVNEAFEEFISEALTIKITDNIDTGMIKEDLRNWFDPKHPQGGWKRINSKGEAIGPCAREEGEAKPKCMSNAKRASLSKKERASAVAAKRRHDPDPDRKGTPINVSSYGKGKISEANETQKKQKLISDKSGKPRLFYIRGSAAKEAHQKGGTVAKVGKRYVVKLKEDLYEVHSPDNNAIEALYGQNSSTPSAEQLGKVRTDTRRKDRPSADKPVAEGRRTISLSSIKENFQKKIQESIDKGIEPGISMTGAGESSARDTGEKLDKDGKATQVKCNGTGAGAICPMHGTKNCRLEELTGDTTTASIGDQKEDELKKKTISLTTFKKRNYV